MQPPLSDHGVFRTRTAWGSAGWAAVLFVGGALACGKTAQQAADGSFGGVGGVGTDASAGTGGLTETGGATGAGTGGVAGTGGAIGDAGTGVACSDDGGLGLSAAARQCTLDSDCTVHVAATCCGADRAFGIAKAQADAYAGCFALPPGACSGLGCPKFLGYLTDTGQITPFQGTTTQSIDLVSVQCVAHLCTTEVLTPADAGLDVASAVDAELDAATPSCGNSICHSGQTCLLVMPGPAPRCLPLVDGGCSEGLVQVATCGGGYLPPQSPGCTDPRPTPYCADIPDGCGDLCDCLCPSLGGGGCMMTFEYMACAYP
jgi:hypothetical protein